MSERRRVQNEDWMRQTLDMGHTAKRLLGARMTALYDRIEELEQKLVEVRELHRPLWIQSPVQNPTTRLTEEPQDHEPVGCVECYPSDGSWPCATRLTIDEEASDEE